MNEQPMSSKPSRGAALPESHERRCVYCKSEQIAPVGRVIADGWLLKEQVRCERCRTVFLVCQTSAL